jgi:hypothetical protein
MSAVVVDGFSQNFPATQSLSGGWNAVYVNRKRFNAESNLIRWDTQELAILDRAYPWRRVHAGWHPYQSHIGQRWLVLVVSVTGPPWLYRVEWHLRTLTQNQKSRPGGT